MCGAREKALVAGCPPRVTDGRETQDRAREAQRGEQAGRWGSGPAVGTVGRGRPSDHLGSAGQAHLPCPCLRSTLCPPIFPGQLHIPEQGDPGSADT